MLSTLKVAALAFAAGIAPPPESDIIEWAKNNVVVPDGPRAGDLWDPELTPYLVEPLRKLSPHDPTNRVSIRKSAQSGFSMGLIAWVGYLIDQAPGQILLLQPSKDAVMDFNSDKLDPTIKHSRCLKRKVAEAKARSGDGSTISRKRFPGGSLVLAIASSARALSSKTVKYLARDEVDRYPRDVEGQGSPLDLSSERQTAFDATGDWKCADVSTPTNKGESAIDEAFDAGDQRYYHVPCPHCGHEHKLEWANFRFEEEWPFKAWFVCPDCGGVIEGTDRKAMLAKGRWVAEKPGPGRHASYHIWAAYNPLTRFETIAEKWVKAQGDPIKLKGFDNLTLGISHEVQGEAPEWEALQKRDSAYGWGEIPASALFLTAGVDVQADRLEASAWGWGIGMTSYLLEHEVIEGNTNDAATWAKLTDWWVKKRQTVNGRERIIERIAVDSGYRPTRTYEWCRTKPGALAIKGSSSRTDWAIDQGRVLKYKRPNKLDVTAEIKVHLVGTYLLKMEIYGGLNLELAETGVPLGYVNLASGTPDEVLRQLVSEKLVTVSKKNGDTASEWHRLRDTRNEVLDCGVYARAAASNLGLSRKSLLWWQEQARELGAPPEPEQADLLERLIAADAQRPAGRTDNAERIVDQMAEFNRRG